MKAIVTAQALILMPGVVMRLSDEDARDRKHCMQPLGDGLYRATLENHFKKGCEVEFEGEIPKQYTSSCEPIGDDGGTLPPASGGVARLAHFPQAQASTAVAGADSKESQPRIDLDGMTKAQLLECAEQHQLRVDSNWNKQQLVTALKKKLRAEAAA
jgi:hypothetical protein